MFAEIDHRRYTTGDKCNLILKFKEELVFKSILQNVKLII